MLPLTFNSKLGGWFDTLAHFIWSTLTGIIDVVQSGIQLAVGPRIHFQNQSGLDGFEVVCSQIRWIVGDFNRVSRKIQQFHMLLFAVSVGECFFFKAPKRKVAIREKVIAQILEDWTLLFKNL